MTPIFLCYAFHPIRSLFRVEALGEIAEQLGKKSWNFNLKHCDTNLNWQTPIVDSSLMYDCTVNCTCLSDDECHISAIILLGCCCCNVAVKRAATRCWSAANLGCC